MHKPTVASLAGHVTTISVVRPLQLLPQLVPNMPWQLLFDWHPLAQLSQHRYQHVTFDCCRHVATPMVVALLLVYSSAWLCHFVGYYAFSACGTRTDYLRKWLTYTLVSVTNSVTKRISAQLCAACAEE